MLQTIPNNKFYYEHSPRGIPESMHMLNRSFDNTGTIENEKMRAKRKMPTSGPFSIAAAKIRNTLDKIDDID